jgi:hypothetical protein
MMESIEKEIQEAFQKMKDSDPLENLKVSTVTNSWALATQIIASGYATLPIEEWSGKIYAGMMKDYKTVLGKNSEPTKTPVNL